MWCGRWLVASEPDVVNHTELKGAADVKFMNKFSLITKCNRDESPEQIIFTVNDESFRTGQSFS